jgi:hypothetical protein
MQSVATAEQRGIEKYREYLGPRYATLLDALETFIAIGGKTIVELGTTRSFVSGGFPGCMVNDPRYWAPAEPHLWDWGAGVFTRVAAEHLQEHGPQIHSVDVSLAAIQISQVITADLAHLITYHHASSEDFLRSFTGTIDLLYMDAGETGLGADQLHLREAMIVVERRLLSPRGVVLIDDVHIPGTKDSKGRLSIPFLCQQGFQIRTSGYQVVLQAPDFAE